MCCSALPGVPGVQRYVVTPATLCVSTRQRQRARICAATGSQIAALASSARRQPSRSPGEGYEVAGVLVANESAARASVLIVAGGSIVRAGSTTGVRSGGEVTVFMALT